MRSHPEKCPVCGGRLAEGVLTDRGHYNHLRNANWHDTVPEAGLFGLKFKSVNLRAVRGTRCEACGYLMLFALERA